MSPKSRLIVLIDCQLESPNFFSWHERLNGCHPLTHTVQDPIVSGAVDHDGVIVEWSVSRTGALGSGRPPCL